LTSGIAGVEPEYPREQASTVCTPAGQGVEGPGHPSVAPRSRVRIGDEVEVVVDTERMHFFDPDTGNAIRT
jgi:hypothetical protein